MKKYNLILINNDQGASDSSYHETMSEVLDYINSWQDPEYLTAKLYNNESEQKIYHRPAQELWIRVPVTDTRPL